MKLHIFLFYLIIFSFFSCKGQNNNANQLKPGDTINTTDVTRIKLDTVTTTQNINQQNFISYTVNIKTENLTIENTSKNKLNYKQLQEKKEEQKQEMLFAIPITHQKGKSGLLIKNGEMVFPKSNKNDSLLTGVFMIKNNRQIGMGLVKDFQDEKNAKTYTLVTEGGAFLYNRGDLNNLVKTDTTRHYVSAMGITNQGTIVFGISKKEVSYDELLRFMINQKKCMAVMLLNTEKTSFFSPTNNTSPTAGKQSPVFIVTKKLKEKPVEYAENQLNKNIKRITYLGKNYIVCSVNTNHQNVELFNKNKQGGVYDLQEVNNEINKRKKKHIFSMNAGMYDKKFSPIGLYVNNGKESHPVNLQQQGYGNFYSLPPNGIFVIDSKGKPEVISTQAFIKKYKPSMVKLATQSGPMMVINGKFNKAFNQGSPNLNIRNGIGVDSKGNIIAVISEDEVNFFEFSSLFKDKLHCNNALYLDGVVSQWFAPKLQEKSNSKYQLGTIITFYNK